MQKALDRLERDSLEGVRKKRQEHYYIICIIFVEPSCASPIIVFIFSLENKKRKADKTRRGGD